MPTQLRTPAKNKIRGAAEFCTRKGISFTKTELGRMFDASRMQVDYALQDHDDNERTHLRSSLRASNARKLTERDLDHIEFVIDENGSEGHDLKWNELIDQFGLDVSAQTLRIAMSKRSFFTFIATDKPYINEALAAKRVEFAKLMLAQYPQPEDWRHVRFSDEVHFGWGPEGKQLIIRRKGRRERGKPDNIRRRRVRDKHKESDDLRVHFWGAIGYNFKSKLIRYSVPTNKNGKMSQRVYIDAVLSTEVWQWTQDCVKWTLEEDGDSGHGKAENNGPAERYKRLIGLSRTEGPHRYYFNCVHSPDLSVIEDA